MHCTQPALSPRVALTSLALALSLSSHVAAQPTEDFSTVRYRPAVGPGNYLALEGSEVQAAGSSSYALAFDYSRDTLVVDHPCRALSNVARCVDRSVPFIEQTALAHLLTSIGLGRSLQLSLGLPLGGTDTSPFSYWSAQPDMPSVYREIRPRNGFVLGDLRVSLKSALYRSGDGRLRVAVAAFTTAPTARATSGGNCSSGENCTFMGERSVQTGANGIVEIAPAPNFRAALTVGALYRPSRSFLGLEVGSELSYGAAASYTVADQLAIKAELQGAVELAGADDLPLEARAGLSYGRDLVLTAGAGAGIVRDVGSPEYRVFCAVQWTPTYRDFDADGFEDDSDRCPREREDVDRFEDGDGCPDPDNDGDGVLDASDGCDDAPEDRDAFADDDGCPELDNDGDGVPDGYDSCEGEKEDRDGDHDDDGCPDLDRDRDGVPDASDRCVDEAEDTDGLSDEDGCPEADFDQDGFRDEVDACPEQPGPTTGAQGDDGCPA